MPHQAVSFAKDSVVNIDPQVIKSNVTNVSREHINTVDQLGSQRAEITFK